MCQQELGKNIKDWLKRWLLCMKLSLCQNVSFSWCLYRRFIQYILLAHVSYITLLSDLFKQAFLNPYHLGLINIYYKIITCYFLSSQNTFFPPFLSVSLLPMSSQGNRSSQAVPVISSVVVMESVYQKPGSVIAWMSVGMVLMKRSVPKKPVLQHLLLFNHVLTTSSSVCLGLPKFTLASPNL